MRLVSVRVLIEEVCSIVESIHAFGEENLVLAESSGSPSMNPRSLSRKPSRSSRRSAWRRQVDA
jgi:hypothetical protein